jgi:hypothetical protein
MRLLLFVTFLLLSTAIIKAQKPYDNINPDGAIGYLSFHITPYWAEGHMDVTFEDNSIADYEMPSTFNLNFKLKFPVSNKITFSAFYEYRKLKDEFKGDNVFGNSSVGRAYKYGGTISFYMN